MDESFGCQLALEGEIADSREDVASFSTGTCPIVFSDRRLCKYIDVTTAPPAPFQDAEVARATAALGAVEKEMAAYLLENKDVPEEGIEVMKKRKDDIHASLTLAFRACDPNGAALWVALNMLY